MLLPSKVDVVHLAYRLLGHLSCLQLLRHLQLFAHILQSFVYDCIKAK